MYRTAPSRKPPDTVAVCRACGVRAEIVLSETETFTCAKCALEQRALRTASDRHAQELTLVGQEPAEKYPELEPFVQSLGGKGSALQVSVDADGMRVLVSLRIDSGSVRGLEMAAAAPGLPDLTLVREEHEHHAAKAKGLVHEAQTGDAAFDENVYIETKLRDEDVRVVLASPAVRAAVLELLETVDTVTLRDGYVKVDVPKRDETFDPARIKTWIALVRVVAGATRPIVSEEVADPSAAKIARSTMFFLTPLALAVGLLGGSMYGPVYGEPYFVGIAVGVVLALVVYPLLRRALAGRSTSHREILGARAATLIFLPVLATGALFLYNGLADRSPPRKVTMRVASVSTDDDDKSKIHVEVRDERGRLHSYTFVSPTLPGTAYVIVEWRSGALGWTWQSNDAILLVDGAKR